MRSTQETPADLSDRLAQTLKVLADENEINSDPEDEDDYDDYIGKNETLKLAFEHILSVF